MKIDAVDTVNNRGDAIMIMRVPWSVSINFCIFGTIQALSCNLGPLLLRKPKPSSKVLNKNMRLLYLTKSSSFYIALSEGFFLRQGPRRQTGRRRNGRRNGRRVGRVNERRKFAERICELAAEVDNEDNEDEEEAAAADCIEDIPDIAGFGLTRGQAAQGRV